MNPVIKMISLNGQPIDKADVLNVVKDTGRFQKLPEYLKDVYSFINEWLGDNKTITLQTSGSTGLPKTIHLKKKHMIASALLTQQFFGLNEKNIALLCLPVKYIAGKMMVVRAFVSGYNLITVPPKSNPFETIKHTVDFTALTPHQLFHSLKDIRRLKVGKIIVGGGEISPELEKETFGLSSEIYATYGMTETCSHVAVRKVNGIDAADFYKALPGISFETDKRECLVIHAPALSDNTIVTNDVVELIDKTNFRWLGRFDNVINTGGIKIFPETVEKKISGKIKRSFFIGKTADMALAEKLVLYIEGSRAHPGEVAEIKDNLFSVLDPVEIPKEIIFIGKFIISESGKIIREKTLKTLKSGGTS